MSFPNFASGDNVDDATLNQLVDMIPKHLVYHVTPPGVEIHMTGAAERVFPVVLWPACGRYLCVKARMGNTSGGASSALLDVAIRHLGQAAQSAQINLDSGSGTSMQLLSDVVDLESIGGEDVVGYQIEVEITLKDFGSGTSKFSNVMIYTGMDSDGQYYPFDTLTGA